MSETPVAGRRSSRRRVAPDPIREDGVGRDVLEARCGILEMAVAKLPGLTPELMAANRPGGAENKDPSAMGWLTYLCWLNSQYGRGSVTPTARALRWDAQAMADMRDALAAEPIPFTLSNGQRVSVHPKGDYALKRVADGQLALQWVTERRLALMLRADEAPTADVLDLLHKATNAEAELLAEFVAIVTHPGAGVPWGEANAWTHTAPQWMRDELTVADYVALQKAFYEVNLFRINAIAERSRHLASGGEPLPLPAFLGIMADEMRVKPETLARHYSLGEIFAMSYAKFEAQERAKAKAERDRAMTAPAKR